MRAVYIPTNFDPIEDLEKLNKNLKNASSINQTFGVNCNNINNVDVSGTVVIISED